MQDHDFLEYLEEKVRLTIDEHSLISPKDKVLVAVSGGKDSTTALFILHKLGFHVEGLIIDQLLGEHSKKNLDNITSFCKESDIRLHVVHMRDIYGCSVCYMKTVLDGKGIHLNSCTICGVIRRNVLNRKAREIGATCLVTGHNLDDEVQTLFMNFVRGDMSCLARTSPKSGVIADKRFVQRVKPLYFCLESEVKRYSQIRGFPVVYEPCPCSLDSYRTEVKKYFNLLEMSRPGSKRIMMAGFLRIISAIKAECTGKSIDTCSLCAEPSSGKICRTCALLGMMSEKPAKDSL
jgi:uncharacterized protein (TIGR00269 family)